MAVTTAFLTTCRTAIRLSSELTGFQTAYALFAAATGATRSLYWNRAYSDAQAGLSPAYRLRKLIRETVTANADITITPGEQQTAYGLLVDEFAPKVGQPMSTVEERLAMRNAMDIEQFS